MLRDRGSILQESWIMSISISMRLYLWYPDVRPVWKLQGRSSMIPRRIFNKMRIFWSPIWKPNTIKTSPPIRWCKEITESLGRNPTPLHWEISSSAGEWSLLQHPNEEVDLSMYVMEQIPTMMVRGNLKRGTTLCSFLVQNRKNVGIRFYQFTGYSRTKGVKMYSTFETKDYLFSSPKSRMSQGNLERVYNDLQEFSKNGESTRRRLLSYRNLLRK